ncbi:MAG: ribosomal-processing cysteine protease Prp [Cetobacterium sp.]|uniref:ribosomal-processing cysteine protease Prp n=1 Tax=unclassified Cetobacterium TaxID=2630983 RepID=UPI00163BCB71|nr:ribosomal-processing cysteine protease Prp [Cetobacterium sp. 2A]MBC2856450.1 ribosomal-processing cysteine protease Prp [Cetobacterium sp. 2A]
MTKIEIFRKNGRVIRYKATGHAEYANHGEDIVCAAISMAMQFPLGGMQDVLDITPRYEIDPEGYLEVDLRGMDFSSKGNEVNTLLDTMVLMLKELSKGYPKHLKLVEKEEI